MLESIGPLLGSAFLIGFFGSVHCLAMCGGIAGALGQMRPADSWLGSWGHAGLYSAGRVTSYALAGSAVGALGHQFVQQTGLAVALRLLAGFLIMIFGLHLAGWWNGLAWTERAGAVAWRRISPWAGRLGKPDRVWKVFALGMVWGWLPCGLVYAGLAGASASGGAGLGAAFMICFGLGTLPAMLPISALSDRVGRIVRDRFARRAAGVLLILFGFVSVGGALMPLMHGSSSGHAGHAEHGGHDGEHSMSKGGKDHGAHLEEMASPQPQRRLPMTPMTPKHEGHPGS